MAKADGLRMPAVLAGIEILYAMKRLDDLAVLKQIILEDLALVR